LLRISGEFGLNEEARLATLALRGKAIFEGGNKMRGSLKRVDAFEKVTGRARYVADLKFPGMVEVKVLRSPYAHALIRSIDTEEAMRVKGVLAVLTGKDLPGIPCRPKERPVLAKEEVKCVGDGVAMVVAETEEAAALALEKIKIEYEVLPAVFDPEEALKPGAPEVHPGGNLVCHHKLRRGNIEEGFKEAEIVLERTYRTSRVYHAALEPEAAIAILEPTGEITIYCPTKSPFNMRKIVAEAMNMDLNRIRIVETTIGGSFGGKDYDMAVLGARVALAAKVTGRPARIVLSREESISESTKRHPYILHYRLGAKKDGTLCALEVKAVADAGAYVSKTPLVTWRSTIEAAGPYEIPNVAVDVYGVFTNNVYSDALRGFGSPQVNFAIELLMDELAETLGRDPLDLRRQNGFREGSIAACGQVLHEVSLRECLDEVARASDWENKRKAYSQQQGLKRRGIGMACSFRGSCLGAGGEGLDAAGAAILVHRDGSISISTGIAEVGQGSRTAFARLVTEILGVPPESLSFNPVDTSRVIDSGPTVASRGTVIGGQAVKIAAEKIRQAMAEVAGDILEVKAEEVDFKEGRIFWTGDPSKGLTFKEVAEKCYSRGVSLYSFGWYKAPDLYWDREKGQGKAYFNYVYAACCAEVEVDLETGQVQVLNFWAAHDVGNALNEREVKGQISGGAAMGIGYALLEEIKAQEGRILNLSYSNYLLPTALDTGEITPLIVEHPDPLGPLGARGLGEPATQIVAPAIINAICHALGRRLYEIPATPEKIWRLINNKDPEVKLR